MFMIKIGLPAAATERAPAGDDNAREAVHQEDLYENPVSGGRAVC